jgi:formylglycine-generating enzyme required for sulfatase activity/predicted nucleic acid-binding Zn ribbon protein
MHCPHCGQEHPDQARFCPITGKSLAPVTQTCPRCGREVRLGARFCPSCGESLEARGVRKPALLVSFIILGLAVVVTGGFLIWRELDVARTLNIASQTSGSPTSVSSPSIVETATETAQIISSPPATPASSSPTVRATPTPVPPATSTKPFTPTAPVTSTPFPPTQIASLEGTGLVRMTIGDERDYTPSLSLDQRRMVYASKIGAFWQVVEADPNGGGFLRQITTRRANYYYPQFSADGSSILVSSDMGGNSDIYLLNAETGEIVQQLTDNPAEDITPSWLPDFSGFVFTSNRDGNDEIYLGYLNGSPPLRLTNHRAFDGFPSVSWNGKQIAFYSNRDGDYEIYTMKLDQLEPNRLTKSQGRDADPVFSPDGEWIIFESERSGNYDIYAARKDGGDVRNLTNHPSNDYGPVFSPDGQWLLFQSDRTGDMDLYRMPWIETPETSDLTTESSASPQARINPADGAELMFIPKGDFLMGSDPENDPYFYGAESPSHLVYLDDYWIYRTEVTNAMYQKCVDEKRCPRPDQPGSNTRKEYFGNLAYDNYPVVYVSWKDALAYCKWAGGRLPTEAEWEKAARGIDGRLFPWGDEPPSADLANFSVQDTVAVGSYPDGASPYGVLDMAGNVIEWVFDYFQSTYYRVSPYENPQGPASGSTRVYRGGSYHNLDAALRVVMRGSRSENHANVDIGFRCVMDEL